MVDVKTPCYDPWVLLSYLACATSTIRLGTNVCILPLRHPLQTARAVVTVDRLAGGRVTIGAGVGWLEDEFVWTGQDFHDRGRRTDDIIRLFRRLWSDDVIEEHSEFYDFGPLHFEPKPLQKSGIPIEIGGSSRPALRRAGMIGDGWLEVGARDFDEFTANLAIVQDARRDAERGDTAFEITVGSALAPDLESMHRARDLGATRIMASPWQGGAAVSPAEAREWADRYADEIMGNV
jgi:probable F420-dependent oxidoreductase